MCSSDLSKIRHRIWKEEQNTRFEMDVELIKNSFAKRLPSGFGTVEGRDSDEALAVSGRIKGQSGR